MNDLSKRWPAVFVIGSGVALLLIAFHWHRSGALIAQGDSFFGYDPLNQLRKGFFAWNHNTGVFGANDPSAVWAPWLLVAGLLTKFLGAPVAQILMIWLTLVVSWAGMFALLRSLSCSVLASFAAAWAYTLNPWTMTMLAVDGAPPYMWTLAMIPWYGFFVIDAARNANRRSRWMLIAAIATFIALPMICANPVLLIVFLVSTAVFAGLGAMLAPDALGFRRWLIATMAVCAICSLWWLVPLLNAYRTPAIVPTSAESWAWVVQRASLLNDMRMNSTWAWIHPEYFPFAVGYDANPLTYASGFLLIIGLAVALATVPQPQARFVRYVAAAALAAIFLSKGLHPPLEWLSTLIYRIPGMFLFREPTSKWPLIALPMLAIALAWAADQLMAQARAQRGLAAAWGTATVVLVATAFSASPVLSGRIFHDQTANYHPEAPGLPSQYIRLPGYWRAAAHYVDAEPGGGGILVLPADPYYQVDYDWGYYGADFLPNNLIHRRVLMLTPLGYVQDARSAAIEQRIAVAVQRRSRQLASMLGDLGIRFVLFRGDAHVRNGEVGLPAMLERVAAALSRRPSATFGPLTIFDLGRDVSDGVRVSSDYIAGEYDDISPADVLELRAFGERVPRFESGVLAVPMRQPRAIERNTDPLALGSEYAATALLASGAQPEGHGVLSARGSDVFVQASFLRDETRRADFQSAVTELEPPRQPIGTPLVSAISATSESDGEMDITLFNPGRSFVRTDINVGVQPAGETVYLLQGQAGSFVDTLAASQGVNYLSFHDVWLMPGENDFSLSSRASSRRGARAGVSRPGLRIGLVHLSNLRSETDPGLRPPARARAAVSFARQVNWAMKLGGVRLDIQADELPTMTLQFPAPAGETLRGVITVRANSKRYLCYMRFHPQIPASFSAALIRCFENSNDDVDLHNAIIERVDLEAEIAAPSTPDIANLMRGQLVLSRQWHPSWDRSNQGLGVNILVGTHNTYVTPRQSSYVETSFPVPTKNSQVEVLPRTARLSVLSVGESPCRCTSERPIATVFAFDGLIVARSSLPSAGIVLTNELYDPEWQGLLIRRGFSGIGHLQADGWRNAWSIPGPGTVVFFNLAVVAQLLLMVCGLAAIVILMLRIR